MKYFPFTLSDPILTPTLERTLFMFQREAAQAQRYIYLVREMGLDPRAK